MINNLSDHVSGSWEGMNQHRTKGMIIMGKRSGETIEHMHRGKGVTQGHHRIKSYRVLIPLMIFLSPSHARGSGFETRLIVRHIDSRLVPWAWQRSDVYHGRFVRLLRRNLVLSWEHLDRSVLCENYAVVPPFFLFNCKTPCPKHDVKLHNYALTITTTTHGTCLWSRYPVLVIIRELEASTSRPSVAS